MAKILIVGGVAGGATAATRLRRLSESDQIIMFERDEFISFANCGLPYYLGGVIQDRDRLIVESVESLSAKFHLDIRNFSEVVAVDKVAKKVTVKEVKTGKTYEETFDKLILSPGANPIKPPTKGLDEATNVFTLRNIPDTDKIHDFIAANKPQLAVIVGGGFIGVEMAENLTDLGIHCTIIDLANQILAPLDFDMAKLAQNEMTNHGVTFLLEDVVSEFQDHGKTLVLKSGKVLKTDLVILAIGVRPENTLALQAGLKVGPRGHIMTNKTLQTLDSVTGEVLPDIYAIGDAIEVNDYIDDSKTAIALAWPANRQGRLVADHINGQKIDYKGSLGSSVVKVFDLIAASTGNNEKILTRKNVPFQTVMVSRGNHAGYYPSAKDIVIKLIFSPSDGKILGAQAFGGVGTEKRIDVLATAIKGKLTVRDLPDLELCYAPPFSSAKDPVNIAGYAASNLLDGFYKVVTYDKIDKIAEAGGYLLDIRTALEFGIGHIEKAVNIPLLELRDRFAELPKDLNAPLYVYCNVGHTAYLAIQVLRHQGYTNIYNLTGGFRLYKAIKEKELPESTCCSKALVNPEHTGGTPVNNVNPIIKIKLDACGLQCPGPIMQTYKAVGSLKDGECVQIEATDSGFYRDIEKWCASTGNTLLKNENDKGIYRALIQKGGVSPETLNQQTTNKNTTIVLFSGDMDKAMASMIIGQGSAAMGKNVTIFCTFWGLNLLRKTKKVKVKKSFIEAMFGAMMPRGPKKMGISKMNFGGMGAKMMKSVMKKKNVHSLEDLVAEAMAAGVHFIACTMSMDVMGIHKEELIDGIDYAGVATYLAESDKAGVTLFI
ncbi:MAG: DsrE/DsrF/DrsH-like family protein [Firmicutes bacterium]|nr:DsrE/DsrF/DrsH-like family protein [Bacillota bacterium]